MFNFLKILKLQRLKYAIEKVFQTKKNCLRKLSGRIIQGNLILKKSNLQNRDFYLTGFRFRRFTSREFFIQRFVAFLVAIFIVSVNL